MPIRVPLHLRTLAVPLCLAVAVAVAVAGCGGDDAQRPDTSTGTPEMPSATPTPSTADQLSAAMPTDTELPDGYTITLQCPGGDDCGPGELDNAYVVVSRTGQETDYFTVGLTEFPDAASAADMAERTRADRGSQVGDYDLPAEQTEEGLRPGRRGSGELEDAAVEGWSGYRFLSTYQYLDAEGAAGATMTEGYLLLVRGTTMAAVQVNVPGDAADAVGDRLDAEMQALFNRL